LWDKSKKIAEKEKLGKDGRQKKLKTEGELSLEKKGRGSNHKNNLGEYHAFMHKGIKGKERACRKGNPSDEWKEGGSDSIQLKQPKRSDQKR